MVGLMRHNKVFSMVFSIVSIFILMFSMVFPHSKASADVLTSEKYNNKGWVFSKHLGFFVETDLIRLADGRIAYCLDERLSSPNGNDLEPMGRLSDEAYRVMAYGYPEKQPSELGASNWQEAHFGTQVALWVVNTDISYNDLRFDNPRVKAVVDNILNDVRTKDTTQDLTFDVSPTSHVAHVEGDYFKAGAFKVTTNAKGGSYTPQAINAPKGTYFTNANGEQKTTFNPNEDFYVYFNKNEASGTFQIKVSGDLTKTETLWYKSHDAGVQNSLALVTTKHTPVQENLSVNWASKGSLELNKVDENGTKLAGAKFDVKNAKGETVATITTDENGYGKVDNLDLGTYTVVETQAPNGYVLDATPQKAQVNNGEVASIKFVNKLAKGGIEINKVDDSNKPLAGVEFTVYNEKGEEVTKVVTDNNGKAFVKDLAFGKYSFKETKGLDGYVGSTETYNFEVKESGKTQAFTVVNKQSKGSLKITKTDEEKKPLEGVEFTVYKDGKEFGKVVTNKDGIAEFKNLPFGKYTFKETKGLEGYDVYPFEKDLTISKDGEVKDFNIVNAKIKGNLRVFKKDDNKKPLEGVEFTLYDANGKEIKKLVTDKDGQASYKDLPYGKYSVKETKPLEGYIAPDNTYTFEIDVQNKGVDYEVINKLIKGNIQITKVDDSKKPLKGVEFTVYNSKDKEVTKVVTDKEGKASVKDLPYGKYYFKETKTPTGHVINKQKVEFEVKQNGVTLKFDVINKKIKGNLQINKVDDSNKPLEGVEFTIYDQNDKEITKVVTDKEGKASVKDLLYGKYFVKETKGKEGYVPLDQKLEFNIVDDGKVVELTVTNKQIIGSLEVTKVDVANGKELANAHFEIYNQKGEKVAEGVTDEQGKAKFEKLPAGKYTFKETVAPEGYFLNETVFEFTIKDDGQVVAQKVENEKIPSVKTTATDKNNGSKEMHTSKTVTIQDKVEYKDLLVGKEYTVKGKLMDKATNKPLKVNGKEVTSEAKFKPTEANGSITLEFTFDATGLEEKEVVVFEKVFKDGKEVTSHADIEDKDQTVKFVKPSVKTTATNKADGSKEIHANKSITIQDKVEYTNLVVGKEYTVKGKLMNKATNKPLLIDGKEVTSETKFTAKEKNGFVTLDFTFDGREQQGREVVVFEDLLYDGQVIATHADINDVGQTVRFVEPSIKTTATNKADGSKELDANESVTIQDKVEYKDLIVGKEYVVKGKLMDKATNKPLLIDGKEVTSETKFTAETKDGFIILDFTFNASELQGKEVVVFEELYQDDVLVAIHSDIEDMGQTVKFKVKSEQPKPEQPKPEQPKPEQPKPEQPKPEQPLPQTGGQEDNTMKYAGLGLLATALAGIGYTVVTRRRKQEQN
ncbi:SpaA isopeptide-forming pilin-related protein [Bacillus sp. JJ864]